MIEFNFDKEPTGTTYKDIKKELISLFEPFQHIQSSRTKYINRLYFTPEFILMINKTLKCEMKCNCHPIKNNDYKSFIFNNLYENNTINFDNSPTHFLERLFGIIK